MKKYKYLFKLCISLGLLAYFVYKTDLGKVWMAITDIPGYVFVTLGIMQVASVAINSVKWHVLLPDKRFIQLFKFNLIAQYYSLVLPGQIAGSFVKVYIAGKDEGSLVKVVASVIIDKTTGIIALLGVAVWGVIFSNTALPRTLHFSIVGFMLLGLCLVFILKFPLLNKMILFFPEKFASKHILLAQFYQFLEVWQNYSLKKLFLALFISLLYQLFTVFIILIIADALSIQLFIEDWCWILGILSVALFLPISVAGIGVREFTLVGLLGFMGIRTDPAMAFSFTILGITIFIAMVGGAVELYRLYTPGVEINNKGSEINCKGKDSIE